MAVSAKTLTAISRLRFIVKPPGCVQLLQTPQMIIMGCIPGPPMCFASAICRLCCKKDASQVWRTELSIEPRRHNLLPMVDCYQWLTMARKRRAIQGNSDEKLECRSVCRLAGAEHESSAWSGLG